MFIDFFLITFNITYLRPFTTIIKISGLIVCTIMWIKIYEYVFKFKPVNRKVFGMF